MADATTLHRKIRRMRLAIAVQIVVVLVFAAFIVGFHEKIARNTATSAYVSGLAVQSCKNGLKEVERQHAVLQARVAELENAVTATERAHD
jgi:hypothetical protein